MEALCTSETLWYLPTSSHGVTTHSINIACWMQSEIILLYFFVHHIQTYLTQINWFLEFWRLCIAIKVIEFLDFIVHLNYLMYLITIFNVVSVFYLYTYSITPVVYLAKPDTRQLYCWLGCPVIEASSSNGPIQ